MTHTPACTCRAIVTTTRPLTNATVDCDIQYCPLHAAAPELLEALHLALATIERVNPKVHNSCNGTLDVVRAAIAKAEGR